MDKKENKKWYASPSNWVVALACIILVPVLIVNLWIMIQSKTNQEKVPSVFGYKPFMVLSGSMEGKILKGDLIITKVIDPTTLKVGDIIAFRDSQNTVTTHRIIDEITTNGQRMFITKGDNNKSQDQNLVELDDVEGIYIMRIPGIGSAMKSLSEPTTIIILVVGITAVFGVGFMISNKKQQDKEKQEFLEYKRMKELEEKEASKKTKKTKSIKAEEDEELLEEEDEEEYEDDLEEEEEEVVEPEPKPLPKRKKVSTADVEEAPVKPAKKTTTKKASTTTTSKTKSTTKKKA